MNQPSHNGNRFTVCPATPTVYSPITGIIPVSNRFIVLCFSTILFSSYACRNAPPTFSQITSGLITVRLFDTVVCSTRIFYAPLDVSLENSPFQRALRLLSSNLKIHQPGNQIHLGYAVPYLRFIQSTHSTGKFFPPMLRTNGILGEVDALGFEPRTYGL